MARNSPKMVMNIEFLVHGKPNNYDSWGDNSFDALEDKVCKEYFDQKECLPDSGHLVEIRSWKNIFYSIYSFIEKVKDTSKRPSYCAVTLIFKGVYCRKCSDIFSLLEEVYEKKLVREANLIDTNREFQINWFNDAASFLKTVEKLTIDCINTQFQGLFDDIDDSFTKSVSSLTTALKFNPKDCDSESFFDDLRKEGRIIVSKTTPSKDSLLSGQMELKKAYDEAKSKADLVPSLKTSIQEAENEIVKLKAEKEKLSSEKDQLAKTIEEKDLIIKELKGKLTDKEKEIDFAVEKLRQPLERLISKVDGVRSDTTKRAKGWLKITPYIPIVNLLLLLLLSYLVFRGLYGYDKKNVIGESVSITDNSQIVPYGDTPESSSGTELPDGMSMQQGSPTYYSEGGSNLSSQFVEDCGLQVRNAIGQVLSNNSVINKDDQLTISVRHLCDGYSWHISNGEFSADDKAKTTFIWKVNATKAGDVIITYRPESEDARTNNPNKIVLKINSL